MAKPKKEKGFILIVMLFLLLLVAITAMSLNAKSGLQAKMTANKSADTQTYFGQLALTEKAVWELSKNLWWRTASSPTYNGETFNLKVDKSSGYNDAVIISADKSGYGALKKSLRYYLSSVEYTGFNQPRHIALDTAGNVYVADTANHCIRKIDLGGNVTTVAGRCGDDGYSGDDGLATSAQLYNPAGVAVDAAGNIYIADTYNCCIRKVDAMTSIISRVAGKQPPRDCDYSGYGIPATSAKLNYPYGVEVNAGNIYIADYYNNRIRMIDPAGIITTVAGSWLSGYSGDGGPATSARLNGPIDVFVDSSGNIYIADYDNHCVRKVNTEGNITTVAGTGTAGYSGDGGPATSANLDGPRGIFVDAADNLYIADRYQHVIRVVSGQDNSRKGYIYKLGGTAGTNGWNWSGVTMPAGDFLFDSPASVALPATPGGRVIYVSDWGNNRIRKLTLTTAIEKKLYK